MLGPILDDYQNVLVTGGLGFIGQHLVQALLQLGKLVTLVDNGSTSLTSMLPPDLTPVSVDIRDVAQVPIALVGADLVFHVAGNATGTPSVSHPRFHFETNAVGTFNGRAAPTADVKRVVYISSASVYGRPQYTPMDEEHHHIVSFVARRGIGENRAKPARIAASCRRPGLAGRGPQLGDRVRALRVISG